MDRGAGGAPGLATSLASGGGSSSSAMQLKRLGLMAAVALLRLSNLFEDWILAFMVFAVYLVTGGSYMFYLAWKTLPRDLRLVVSLVKFLDLSPRPESIPTANPNGVLSSRFSGGSIGTSDCWCDAGHSNTGT